MKPLCFYALLWGAALATACGEQVAENPVLTVEGGQLRGVETTSEGVIAYKGIPYAAPPVGDLRWREPQPVKPWKGVKTADSFGPASVQADQPVGSFYQKEFFWKGDPLRSEDCLYLNIWTPAAGKPDAGLPVAMWIHGGAYVQGYGHEIEFDGEEFAKRGVILVTVNYRLGVLGFMAHPLLTEESPHGVSGNYGILDQREALGWLRRNIARFGGDPDNITVFGQSAGAGSVQCLLASPLCRGMIAKAAIQSGGGLRGLDSRENSLADAEASGRAFLDFAGFETLEAMRACPAEKLCSLAVEYNAQTGKAVRLTPNVDGYLLNDHFTGTAMAGGLPDIPYLVGSVAGDSESLKESIPDFGALLEAQGRRPAYLYSFSRALPGDDAGAFHSSELWYLFGTLGRSWRPFSETDRELSVRMTDYWTNFIKTGDPNGGNLPVWKPYMQACPSIQQLDIRE